MTSLVLIENQHFIYIHIYYAILKMVYIVGAISRDYINFSLERRIGDAIRSELHKQS